jgi:hypothetical protein
MMLKARCRFQQRACDYIFRVSVAHNSFLDMTSAITSVLCVTYQPITSHQPRNLGPQRRLFHDIAGKGRHGRRRDA